VTLSQHGAEGVRTLHGMHSRGFSNCLRMDSQQSEPGERSGQNGSFGGGSVAFFEILRECRTACRLEGLELR